jgi:2-polyprenyl-6-hydroxyphenyl methylase/3-demethylubiquinone-9 3-methyltransferase
MLPIEARMLVGALVRGEPTAYFRSWTQARGRGMSRWHDLVDWVGGFPFEVATPEEVFHFCRKHGLELVDLTTAGGGLGCNQFVFRRCGVVADCRVTGRERAAAESSWSIQSSFQ